MKTITSTIFAFLFTLATSASAVPISGSIGFTGSYTHNGNGGTDLSSATLIKINNNKAAVTGNIGGAFATAGITNRDVATYNNIDLTSSGPILGLWSVGGFTFDLNQFTVNYQSPYVLALTGIGTIRHNNYDNTVARWVFTANQVGSNMTFSTSTAPEPGIALLLGVGLAGIAVSRRRRSRNAA